MALPNLGSLERFSETTELLGEVFTHINRRDASRCMRVLRSWKDEAKNRIWREMDDFSQVMSLMKTMEVDEKGVRA